MPLLVIGNKNYSSWSLRPWLLLRHFGVAFEELRLKLDTPRTLNGLLILNLRKASARV